MNVTVDAFRRTLRALPRAAQSFVVHAVPSAAGSTLNDLAAMTPKDRSVVAALVDRLVDHRYLKRTQSGHDRRRASITVTALGQRSMKQAAPPPTMLLVNALRTMHGEERAKLAQGLTALTAHMGIPDEPAVMLFEDAREKRRG